jgi:hypothetical protein
MTIENWAKDPRSRPIYVEVLDRTVVGCEELLYIKGTSIHLGTPHKGWSGDETIVFRRKEENGNWRVFKPLQGSPESFKKTRDK